MSKTKTVPAPYKPTSQEQAVIDAGCERRLARPPAPRVTVQQRNGTSVIGPDHPDVATGIALLMDAVGTSSIDFLSPLLSQLANAAGKGSAVDEDGLNFMLSVVKGIEPKDQVEAMLAAQMAAVHVATMTFARRLNHVENIPQQDSAERAFNKLTRTFTTQMEALKRYRTGGQQTVRVERVTVNEGGQAIVGSVTHAPGRGRGSSEKAETTP